MTWIPVYDVRLGVCLLFFTCAVVRLMRFVTSFNHIEVVLDFLVRTADPFGKTVVTVLWTCPAKFKCFSS